MPSDDSINKHVQSFLAKYEVINLSKADVLQPFQALRDKILELEQQKALIAGERDRLRDLDEEIAKSLKSVKDQGSAISKLQSGISIEQVAARSFPSTRFGVRTYPVAPSDIDDVFLTNGILTVVRRTQAAMPTEIPRATDVRNYLRHEIEGAYNLLEHYQGDIDSIAALMESRELHQAQDTSLPAHGIEAARRPARPA